LNLCFFFWLRSLFIAVAPKPKPKPGMFYIYFSLC